MSAIRKTFAPRKYFPDELRNNFSNREDMGNLRHSERSEESLRQLIARKQRGIPRFARNDECGGGLFRDLSWHTGLCRRRRAAEIIRQFRQSAG
jgi:hypothetical protein